MRAALPRRIAAEAIGTAFVLAVIIGSGIMGERLAGGNVAIALLANSLATAFGLAALILALGPISGAHFNPVVTLVAAIDREIEWRDVMPYIVTQCVFAFAGVAAAHLMFSEPLFSASVRVRTGPSQWFSEFVAAFGLVVVILGCARRHASWTPVAVAGYIGAAYWFTSSTSFANPAVTLARAASNTFAGVRPDDVAGFIVAQVAGGLAAMLLMRWVAPKER